MATIQKKRPPAPVKKSGGAGAGASRPRTGNGAAGVKRQAPTASGSNATKPKAPSSPSAPRDQVTLSSRKDDEGPSRLPNLSESFGDVAPAAEARGAENKPAQPDEHFRYTPRNYQDLTDAQLYHPESGKNHMTGTQANQQINDDYHQANQDMQRYLAGDPNGEQLPPVADWMTFGKFASREAGEVIRNTEDAIQTYYGDPKAAADLARNGPSMDNVTQGLLAGTDLAGRALGKHGPNLPAASGEIGGKGMETLHDVHGGFVKGNTEIHKNIAPAYDAFLNGESNGTGGMESLKEAGYTPGSKKDPQGFVSGAFNNYQQARELGLQAQQEKDPAKKKEMLAQRQKLMERGNLMLGMQEQMEILQTPQIFENKNVQNAVKSIGGTMGLTDANGKHKLLPNGGDWSDFQTRMGLKPVAAGTEGAIPVKGPDGKTTNYVPDPSKPGTIVDYFTRNAGGQNAANLNANPARPTEIGPSTPTGESIDGIGRGLASGDNIQVAANGAALPSRVVSDVAGATGDVLTQSGNTQVNRGQQSIRLGQQRGGVDGLIDRAAGTSEVIQGRVKQTAGAASEFTGQQAERFGNHVEDVVDSYRNGVVMPWDKRAKWWVKWPF